MIITAHIGSSGMQGSGRKQGYCDAAGRVAALPAGITYVRTRKRETNNPTAWRVGLSFHSFHGTHLLEHRSCWPVFLAGLALALW